VIATLDFDPFSEPPVAAVGCSSSPPKSGSFFLKGYSMSHSRSMVGSVGVAVTVTAMVIVGVGSAARASDGFSGCLVGGSVDLNDILNDMQRLAEIDSSTRSSAPSRAAASRGLTRQSVPARDRAASYRSNEVFGHSKVALPLLVADLEPQQAGFDIRPMSGRSVGARPAAAWTRPLIRPLNAADGPARDSSTSWSSYGRR
jgi:hypothetical protein